MEVTYINEQKQIISVNTFNVNDEVYYLYDNKIYKLRVTEVNIKQWEYNDKINFSVRYKTYSELGTREVASHEIFETPEAITEHLLSQYKNEYEDIL